MKKLLLLLALCTSLCLIGCKNNEQQNNNNQQNNSHMSDSNQNKNNENELEENNGIAVYENTDFSEKAGFKINLGDTLKDVKYDSIFLIHNSTAQLDLIFPDNTIGTLLVDTNGYLHLTDTETTVMVDDIKVSIEIGADGIIVYEWLKDNVSYTYSTNTDLKESDILTNLVKDITLER